MDKIIEGRVWKFGENISTDSIAPGNFNLRARPKEYALHCMEYTRPEFAKNVKQGDILVADRNFGCGSSREIAPMIIGIAGIEVVIAKTFSRLFYRNAVNIGLPIIEIDTDDIADGEILRVDMKNRVITKPNDPNYRVEFSLSDKEVKIIDEGGLLNYLENHGSFDDL